MGRANSRWQGGAHSRRAFVLLAALAALALLALVTYLVFRLGLIAIQQGSTAADRVMATLLIGAELMVGVHAVGFFVSVWRAARARARSAPAAFASFSRSPVAILVASYNESEDVLDETLASLVALDYPARRVYLLDDSTRDESREAARRVAARYGAELVRRPHRAGYKAGAINEQLPRLEEPYVAILDADQRPNRSWLTETIPELDADERLAFVQAPQIYTNLAGLRVAQAAQSQQAVFFGYICESKSVVNAMFCCGSNVVFRRDALLSLATTVDGRTHYFDESSVTEDFATTVELHARGWRTLYVNQPHVMGMGPETLAAYFTQQMRWAMGAMGVCLRLLRRLLREPRILTPVQWWEYLLSGSYYFTGAANIVFMLAPAAYFAADVRPVRLDSTLYVLLVAPSLCLNIGLFFAAMGLRGQAPRRTWLASALQFSTFWIYTKAAIVAVFGLRRAFGVTPKGVGGRLALSSMLPELIACSVSAACALAALLWLVVAGPDLVAAANGFWGAYNALQLSTLFFYFNRRVTIPERSAPFLATPASA